MTGRSALRPLLLGYRSIRLTSVITSRPTRSASLAPPDHRVRHAPREWRLCGTGLGAAQADHDRGVSSYGRKRRPMTVRVCALGRLQRPSPSLRLDRSSEYTHPFLAGSFVLFRKRTAQAPAP